MKATRQSIGRSVDQPDSKIRLFLFHGQDDSQSRALGQRVLEALSAAKLVVPAGAVKADPASLVDEAGAMSLFGERRAIWIDPAGDEIVPGVEALLEAASIESPVIAIGGALRKSSGLLKLAEASRMAVGFASYMPEGQEAQRMVVDLGRSVGLKVDSRLAARISDVCANDRAIVMRELEKFALYLGASPHSIRELDDETVDAVGADTSENNPARLADLALGGDVNGLAEEVAQLSSGTEAIPVLRALQRRLLMLAPARARMERGESLDGVMTSLGKALFWKDKSLVSKMLAQWDAERLGRIAERTGQLERSMIFSPVPDQAALGEELIAIALQARRHS